MRFPSASWPFSSILLAAFGAALLVMGIYFMLLRPTLLPEDLRYMGISSAQLSTAVPRLAEWLNRVFSVLGGHIIAAGILMVTLAVTSFRQHHWGAAAGVFLAGAASIGWMVIVNFIIDSDYKLLLLAIFALWVFSLGLFWFEKKKLR